MHCGNSLGFARCNLIPDNEQATAAYEEALLLLRSPEQREKRADTLDRLAVCLYNRDEEHWERMTEVMRRSCANLA